MAKLIESTVSAFLDVLKSEAPAPGGGAVAALTAAQGAALIMMVANLTIGKAKYAEWEALNIQVRGEAEGLLGQLASGVDADKAAFEQVSAAYGLPRQSEADKQARRDAIAVASVGAADAPLAVMRASLRALTLAEQLVGQSNPNLVSDLYVAALNLRAGIESARYNVEVNLPAIRDRALAERWAREAADIAEQSAEIAARILGR